MHGCETAGCEVQWDVGDDVAGLERAGRHDVVSEPVRGLLDFFISRKQRWC